MTTHTTAAPIKRDLLLLALLLSLLFGLFLGSRPLMTPDEGRYAEIPREMVVSGDYITPRLNYVKYFEKPPFLYWMEAAAIHTFGLNEWSLRLGIALLSIVGCLMTYLGGLSLYSRGTGILACITLATCVLYFSMAHFLIPDMPLTVWMSTALLLFICGTRISPTQGRRYYFWGMYLCAALAVLTKGLVGAVLPALIIFIWLCATNGWRQLKTYYLPSGILLFLLIAVPWHVAVQLKNPEFFHFYFIDQHVLRYLTDYAGREQAWWFFPTVTLGGFFPWTCFLVAAGIYALINRQQTLITLRLWWQQRHHHAQTIFLVLWAIVIFVFFSLSKSQLLSYALPIMPPLALLAARYLDLHWQKQYYTPISLGFVLLLIITLLGSINILIVIFYGQLFGQLIYVYIFTSLLFLTGAISYGCYCYGGIKWGIIALVITMSACLISTNLIYTLFDTRSIKSLALLIKPQLSADSVIAGYDQYYQDLPVYLQRRVAVVNYKGELEFGTQHQDSREWIMDETAFWQRWNWQNGPQMFMIMSIDQYNRLKTVSQSPLYPLAKTVRDILVSNKTNR